MMRDRFLCNSDIRQRTSFHPGESGRNLPGGGGSLQSFHIPRDAAHFTWNREERPRAVVDAGATVLVAGTAVFGQVDRVRAIEEIRGAAQQQLAAL